MPSPKVKFGFTLVELLVVIAIIGVLVGLLLPAVQAAREAARRMQCSNNFKQLGLALHNYHDVHKRVPAGGIHSLSPAASSGATPGSSRWGPSWALLILPMIEQSPLHNQYNFSLPRTRDGVNATVVATVVPTFVCPSDTSGPKFWVNTVPHAKGNYACSTGPGSTWSITEFPNVNQRGAFSPTFHWGCKFSDVTDGLSNSIFLGEILSNSETGDVRGAWSSPLGVFFSGSTGSTTVPPSVPLAPNGNALDDTRRDRPARCSASNTDRHMRCIADTSRSTHSLRSRHSGGVQIVMGDGSVQFISDSINVVTLRNLLGIADGQVIGEF